MIQKPLIFITNDDGYDAPGIKALIDAVKDLGEILVVAPDGPRSGMSSAITSANPIRVRLVEESEDIKIYACTGTPVDCVKLGISKVAQRTPDIILSGINHGSNASICVLYSGTMGAAIEGCVFKIPSVGFSLLDHSMNADFSESQIYVKLVTKQILKEGLPIGTCLNINIPKGNELKGLRICRQAAGQWIEEFKPSEDGSGKEIYWLTGHFRNDEPDDVTTDEWVLARSYVSIVPIKVDMTDHYYVDRLKEWEDLI